MADGLQKNRSRPSEKIQGKILVNEFVGAAIIEEGMAITKKELPTLVPDYYKLK